MKKIFQLIFFYIFFPACLEADSSLNNYFMTADSQNIERNYCSESELSKRESVFSIFEGASDWFFQYPSGREEDGMRNERLYDGYKSKYLSAFIGKSGQKYIRFSLDASDKGKSKNGSSVRAELRHSKEWTLSDKSSLSYTFYVTSTDLQKAKFTVGQFLQHCSKKDSPLCRIELENGNIVAVVVNYESDGKTRADGQGHRYDLGTIQQNQEVSIKISLDKKDLSIYRDGEKRVKHHFHKKVSSSQKNYFKLGIYYQNKDSPQIFSEIFVRKLAVNIAS